MSLRSPLFGSQQQQPDPNFQDIPTQSWYPPSVVGSSSRPSTPGSSSASPHQRASDHPQHSSRGQPSPAEAAGIIALLKDKSIEELQRLLKDKEAYNAFFNSLDQVKTQNNVRDELKKETLELAKENLEKEQLILELRNQCTKEKATSTTPPVDSVPGCDMDKREKIRQKNEKKHQRQKERRAQELHERCKGYLMSRKLDVLAQKLVAMGFSSDQATMALIQNEGCVEESVTWLCNFDGSEEAKHQLAADQQSAANLKIDIADELAKIVSLEAKYKCTKQEVERSVVSCEGDLEKVEEVLKAHKQESTSVPSKPEGSGDSSGLANKQQVVLAQNPARPQASGFSSVGGQQMRREEKDLNYKLVVNGSGPKEPAIKGFLPTAAQSKPELAHQQFVPPEKRRFNANSVPSVSYVASSPFPVAVPQLKSDMRHAVGGNEMRNAMSSGNLRESVTLMQRSQSSSTKQSVPSTSHSKFALEPSSRDWYSTFNGTSSVDMMLNGGLGHGLRNMSLDTVNSIRPFGHANHQQSFISNPIELAASGWGGTWGSGDTSSRAVVSSRGAFRGWSSSESSSTLSHADWRTNGLAPCDYTSVDWSVGKSLLNQPGKSEQLSDTWSTMFMGGRSARAPGNLSGAGGLHDHNHPMDPAPTPRSYD